MPVDIEADPMSFQLCNGGTITFGSCTSLDHVVLAVGYGDKLESLSAQQLADRSKNGVAMAEAWESLFAQQFVDCSVCLEHHGHLEERHPAGSSVP